MNLRDRVQCATATTGTGTVTLGAATAGYRTFTAAYSGTTANVSYMILDGDAWETGVGTYTKGTNTLSRSLDASSTGSLLSLSGTAVVSLVFLSREHVADWPDFSVSRSAGDGGSAFQTFPGGFDFTTVAFNVGASLDTHGAWSSANNIYTIPQTGSYLMTSEARLVDGDRRTLGYGIGMGTANNDGAGFRWRGGVINRQGGSAIRNVRYNAGDPVRMFMFTDSSVGLNAAEFTITRVR